jgi:hypothetical protein
MGTDLRLSAQDHAGGVFNQKRAPIPKYTESWVGLCFSNRGRGEVRGWRLQRVLWIPCFHIVVG